MYCYVFFMSYSRALKKIGNVFKAGLKITFESKTVAILKIVCIETVKAVRVVLKEKL